MTGQRAGCYLCRDDGSAAEEDACDDCEREFWREPVAILLDEEGQ